MAPPAPPMLSAGVSSLAGGAGLATAERDGGAGGYQAHVTFQRLQEQRRAEKQRVSSLVAGGVVDGSQYVRPDDGDAVQLMESSNVLAPIVGLRQLRRRAAASQDVAAAANPTSSHVAEPEGEDERLTEPPEFVVDALAAARVQLAAVNSQRIR